MNRIQNGVLIFLILAVVLSAISVVYAKFLSRKHFVSLQELLQERERIGVEWGRLQLEEGTLADHSNVVGIAQGRLQMHLPKIDEVVVIRR
jgi:cell division protein FtsL